MSALVKIMEANVNIIYKDTVPKMQLEITPQQMCLGLLMSKRK